MKVIDKKWLINDGWTDELTMDHLRDWIKNLTGQQVTKNEYLKGRQMRRRKEE